MWSTIVKLTYHGLYINVCRFPQRLSTSRGQAERACSAAGSCSGRRVGVIRAAISSQLESREFLCNVPQRSFDACSCRGLWKTLFTGGVQETGRTPCCVGRQLVQRRQARETTISQRFWACSLRGAQSSLGVIARWIDLTLWTVLHCYRVT